MKNHLFNADQVIGLEMRAILSRFFTFNNPVLDMLFGFAAFRLLDWITHIGNVPVWEWLIHFSSLLATFYRFKTEKKMYQLDFEDVGSKSSQQNTLPGFAAIHFKLNQICDGRIYELREKILRSPEDINLQSLTRYECIQRTPIELTPGIFVDIKASELRAENIRKKGLRFYTKLRLQSKIYNIQELQCKVKEWEKELQEYRKNEMIKERYVFSVRFFLKHATRLVVHHFKTHRSFENLIFPTKEETLKEIDFFMNHREWYEARGIPYTLGILCYGPPGCGKTSFIKSLLKYTDRHAIMFSMNSTANLTDIEELMSHNDIAGKTIPQHKRVYVFEDIDAMELLVNRRRRKNKEPVVLKGALETLRASWKGSDNHLGYLLNIIDGIRETPGRIIVMTTNFIEKLDPALIRPGRIDIRINFQPCTRQQICEIVCLYFEIPSETIKLPPDIIDGILTPAKVSQICRSPRLTLDKVIERFQEEILHKKKQEKKMV